MIPAFDQKAVEQNLVQTASILNGFRHTGASIEIEVKAGRSKGQIHVDEDNVGAHAARDRPSHIMSNGGRSDAALSANKSVDLSKLARRELTIYARDGNDQ